MVQGEPSIGIFTTDKDLKVRTWDDWVVRATGISAREAVNRPIEELVPDFSRRGLNRRFQAVLGEGTTEVLSPSFHHYLLFCPSPVPSLHFDAMQQRVTIAPLREEGRICGVMVTVEDVTARMERERDLAETLASSDELTRLKAAESLAGEDSLEAVNPLMSALRDESWRVRKVAVDGLARTGSTEAVASLLRALREEHMNLGVLNSALQTLTLMSLDTVTPLLEFLRDPDSELRLYAALALGEMGDSRAVPALIDALKDPETNVRYHSIEALGRLRADTAVDSLCEIVESRDFYLAFAALDALILINNPGVVPRILPVLGDPMLHEPAVDALGKLGNQQAVEPLAALLNDPEASMAIVCRALASLFDQSVEQYGEGGHIAGIVARQVTASGIANLLGAIDAAEGRDMRALALVLGWMRGAGVERTLVRLLGEPSARREIVDALVLHGPGVLDLLVETLEDEEQEVRKAAVVALGRIGDARAVPPLLEVLDKDRELRVVTCGALAKIGDRRAFDALLELLGHPQAVVRQAVIAALNSLGHPEMAGRMKGLLEAPDAIRRESAVKIAGYFGYPECAEQLYARCRDASEEVRTAALEHIVYLDDQPRALALLTEALNNGGPRVRAAAARALAHVSSEAAEPLLFQGLRDPDLWVRYFAARSLARHRFPTNSREWYTSFCALAWHAREDPAQPVRIAALQALGEMGGHRAIPVLIPLISDDEPDVSRNALAALGSIQHPDALAPLLSALRDARGGSRHEIVKTLRKQGGEQVARVLHWVAQDPDRTMTAIAIEALGNMGSPESVSALLDLSADPGRRESCVAALSRMDRTAITWLAGGLKKKQPVVRSATVEALTRMKDARATAQLTTALDDPDAAVRLAAVTGLAELGVRTGRARLVELARQDPDINVRRAAHCALGAERDPG